MENKSSLDVITGDGMIQVLRTGRTFSIASSEFMIIYPDQKVGTLWSPVWNELSEEAELELAGSKAMEMWIKDSRSVSDKNGAIISMLEYIQNTEDEYTLLCQAAFHKLESVS